MIYIVISILMIIIGIIGILKNKLPKIGKSSGFAADMTYYFSFYLLVIFGVVFLILML